MTVRGGSHKRSERDRIALQQTALGDYRQSVLEHLQDHWGSGFHVYTGVDYFLPASMITVDLPGSLTVVRNRFLLGRRLNWQRAAIRPLIRADVAIVEFNPHVLSVWVILIARRLLSRHTVLWGHAWSRRGPNAVSEPIRQIMRRLCSTVLVYSERQREELQLRMPDKPIVVAPNAMYARSDIHATTIGDGPRDILYVGRLVGQKKPALLLNAFARACRDGLDTSVRLVFAGDGPESPYLRDIVREQGLSDRVVFLGHVAPERMREHYSRAVASASPGYVGLSLVQSLSFGVPMLIAKDEPHSPEIEAAREGFNAFFVASDDIVAWAEAMVAVARARAEWTRRRKEIAADCARRYSAEDMANGFVLAAGPLALPMR